MANEGVFNGIAEFEGEDQASGSHTEETMYSIPGNQYVYADCLLHNSFDGDVIEQ